MAKFIIKVYQHSNMDFLSSNSRYTVGKFDIAENQKRSVTEWLRDWAYFSGAAAFVTSHEIHVLRFLRHSRKPLEGLPKFNAADFEFWFDFPDRNGLIKIGVDDEGNLLDNVPGGFFTQRGEELFD